MPGSRTALFSRTQPGGLFAIQDVGAHPGDIYFVCSVNGKDGAGYGQNPDSPCATIDYAIGLCTASKGDVIYVLPGHAESIASAGAIACDVAGISIIGLGNKNNRPTITFHNTAATIAVSAANVTLKNLLLTNDVDAVVKLLNITAAGCTIDAVDFQEGSSVGVIQFALTTAAADDLTIQNCRWVQSQTAATALSQWIVLTGADRAKITNNYLSLKGYATGNPANGAIVGVTTASLDVEITNNRFIVLNSTGNIPISLLADTTGFVGYNSVHSTKTALAGQIALASCYGSENYASNTVNTSGILDPVADS